MKFSSDINKLEILTYIIRGVIVADEEINGQEQTEELAEEEVSAGSKKTVLIIIILAVMLVAATGVVYFVLYPMYQEMTGVAADSTADSTAVLEDEDEDEGLPPLGQIFNMVNLTVNPKGSMGRRYAVIDLAVEYSDPEVGVKLAAYQPVILDGTLKYLRLKTVAEYSAAETMDSMRVDLKDLINDIIGDEAVTNLYFTRYVLE